MFGFMLSIRPINKGWSILIWEC